jgi:hypothetical protein
MWLWPSSSTKASSLWPKPVDLKDTGRQVDNLGGNCCKAKWEKWHWKQGACYSWETRERQEPKSKCKTSSGDWVEWKYHFLVVQKAEKEQIWVEWASGGMIFFNLALHKETILKRSMRNSAKPGVWLMNSLLEWAGWFVLVTIYGELGGRMGSSFVAQAGLELLGSNDPATFLSGLLF